MNQLNYYPLPKPQESAISLIFRCAAGNGISTAHLLVEASTDGRAVKKARALWQGFGPCELLTSYDGLSSEEAEAIRSCFYRSVRHDKYPYVEVAGIAFPSPLLRQHLALCPGCARDGYLNHMHIFTFNETCPAHGERYITQCPNCKKPLNWPELSDYICPCKFDLRETPTTEFNTQTSRLISNAVEAKNEHFFTLLLAAIAAMRFLHTVDNRPLIIDHCARIATGNKTLFFREMDRIQEHFPSLHRRAILAPLILSDNLILGEYAMEYLFRSSQTQPMSHPSQCLCGQLSYTGKELSFILNTHNIVQTKGRDLSLNAVALAENEPASQQRYQCHELCKLLHSQRDLQWDNEDLPGEPGESFDLLGLKSAAVFLDTTTSIVRALITSGLLKGHSVSHPNGWRTSLESLQKFGQKYALRSEIVRRSGLEGGSLKKLLTGLAPMSINITRFGSRLLIYQRKHLSEEMRLRLDKKDLAFLQPLLPADGLLSFKTVEKNLNLDTKDVRELREAGILLTAPCIGNRGARSERCTAEGVQLATEWRKQHLSVSELSKITGYSTRTIHMRYLDTGAIPFIKLNAYFMHVDSAKIIEKHLNLYITWSDLCSMTGMGVGALNSFLEKKLLIPLTPEHADAVKGLILFKANEAKQFVTEHCNKKFREVRRPTPPYVTARRPDFKTSLSTPEQLDVIVRTCCFSLRS